MKNERALEKIKKCLSLAESDNPHEAANAWKQAQTLMRRYNIDNDSVLASEISTSISNGSAAERVPEWEMLLIETVGKAFDCEVLRQKKLIPKKKGLWLFIGAGANPQIASYAFEVLFRQIRSGRRKFLRERCADMFEASKRKHVDLYSSAWAYSLYQRVKDFAYNERDGKAIKAYITREYSVDKTLSVKGTGKKDSLTVRDRMAIYEGHAAAKNSRLHHGMPGQKQTLIASKADV